MTPAEEGKLSKEEVETLLRATRSEEGEAERPEPSRRVTRYDFKQPSRFKKSDLDGLRRINDELAARAGSVASRLLRSGVGVQLVSMDQMKWENLLEETGEALIAFVFVMEPLECRGVLTLERPFASVCLDRMTGGPGEAGDEEEFGDLDVRVLRGLAKAFLEPLPELWEGVGPFTIAFGPFTDDLQSLDLFSNEEDFFQLSFLVQGSIGSGQVTLAVPFQAVRELPPERDGGPAESPKGDDELAIAGDHSGLDDVRVDLAVVLGTADIEVAELVQVAPGDVLVLDRPIDAPLDVCVNGLVKFRGYGGTSRGKRAVKLIMEG
jgi:flagellar motor switch protein FliM